MMDVKLYMVLLGCKPAGRNTEQHDIFFGIGNSLGDIKKDIEAFWPNAGKIHIDAWRAVTNVVGHAIEIIERKGIEAVENNMALFFLNLGGYKQHEFEEYHYKMLQVAPNKSVAVNAAMKSTFYKHTGFEGATSHIDDKYGVDVDDIFAIEDILPDTFKQQYAIVINQTINTALPADDLHLGYLKWTAF
jgi:hypothetical protein